MNVVLGVSGGIAAYKAPDLVRRFQDAGADVRVIVTENGARFVSVLALAAVSGSGVISDQWGDPAKGGVDHIDLARWAGVLLIAPASANVIAKLAVGIADDALTTYAVAHRGEIAIAPSMNTQMLEHPTVRENLDRLRERGVLIITPDAGLLACGDEGAGRMPDPAVLVEQTLAAIHPRDLTGKKVLVTAGPTREPVDPVRYLSNRSSGRMGYAVAEAARSRGADVTLITGPTSLASPAGVTVSRVTTAEEMFRAVTQQASAHDILIKAAAVADYRPANVASLKIKKSDESSSLVLELEKTDDILQAVAALPRRPFTVAFAAETDAVEENARLKLERKGADLMVANDVSNPTIGFDAGENEVLILSRDGRARHIPRASKTSVAHAILDAVAEELRG